MSVFIQVCRVRRVVGRCRCDCIFGGFFGFVSELLCGGCEAVFGFDVVAGAVADAVGREVAVFEVEPCLFCDVAEDSPETVFVVAVAVLSEPDGVSAVVPVSDFSLFKPVFEDSSGLVFQWDHPVLSVLGGVFAGYSEDLVFDVDPGGVGAFDFDESCADVEGDDIVDGYLKELAWLKSSCVTCEASFWSLCASFFFHFLRSGGVRPL